MGRGGGEQWVQRMRGFLRRERGFETSLRCDCALLFCRAGFLPDDRGGVAFLVGGSCVLYVFFPPRGWVLRILSSNGLGVARRYFL